MTLEFNTTATTAENSLDTSSTSTLPSTLLDHLASRGLSEDTALKVGLRIGEYAGQRAMVWPLVDHQGNITNNKYRLSGKDFRFDKGKPITLINAGAVARSAKTGEALVFTEGEYDLMTAVQAGYECAVSVPNGADSNLECLDDVEGMWTVQKIILAVDNDEPGMKLRANLVQRIKAGYCWSVEYPEGCKDLNDVLVAFGDEGVKQVLDEAQPMAVEGLTGWGEGVVIEREYFRTGWANIDNLFLPYLGSLTIITATPGSGKSSWGCQFLAQMARIHGHSFALASPEEDRDELEKKFKDYARGYKVSADDLFTGKYHEISEAEDSGEAFTIEYVLERAETAVRRYGIRWLFIDPWNQFDHPDERDHGVKSQQDTLKKIKRWAKKWNVGVICSVHPTKDVAKSDGSVRELGRYDMDGSAHFLNSAHYVLGLMRCEAPQDDLVMFRVLKVRTQRSGRKPGDCWITAIKDLNGGLLRYDTSPEPEL